MHRRRAGLEQTFAAEGREERGPRGRAGGRAWAKVQVQGQRTGMPFRRRL